MSDQKIDWGEYEAEYHQWARANLVTDGAPGPQITPKNADSILRLAREAVSEALSVHTSVLRGLPARDLAVQARIAHKAQIRLRVLMQLAANRSHRLDLADRLVLGDRDPHEPLGLAAALGGMEYIANRCYVYARDEWSKKVAAEAGL